MENKDRFLAELNFNRDLKLGQRVEIRWTNNGGYFSGFGPVTKVNAKTVRVTLEAPVANREWSPYPAGREIIAPRFLCDRQSVNNGVFQVKEQA